MKPTVKPTVLVADDEAELRHILSKTLTKEGYRVLTAGSGSQVLKLMKKEEVQLLLLDLKMPGMDGIEVMKRVRKGKPGVVVLILTAHGSPSSAREAMRLGATDYLTKPFDLDVVKAVVREALREK